MRTWTNVALQAGAVVAFVLLRFTAPGWFLVILVITIVGPVLLIVPTVLALATVRRRVLPSALAAPFATAAGLLLLGGLTMPDFGDTEDSVQAPLTVLLDAAGLPGPSVEVLYPLGGLALFGWGGAMLWLGVALIVDARRTHRVAGPPHPAWARRAAG